jgi:NtrC-family two-component system response regulator AlgB
VVGWLALLTIPSLLIWQIFIDETQDLSLEPAARETNAEATVIGAPWFAALFASANLWFLRFVQEQSFEHVGGENTIHLDTRIIAASNRDLPAEVTAHHFREDLFYGLNVIPLRVPPLRERAEDICPLAERLLTAVAVRNRRAPLHFSPDAHAVISNYRWPGNVRELLNAVERAVVLSWTDLIGPECLPDALFQPLSQDSNNSSTSLDDLEREHIVRVLSGSPTLQDAAERLGINVTTLWHKRKRYHLD